jgi:hypothetical protein
MKIFVLDVPEKFKPKNQPFAYPKHNFNFGVEQDFELFLKNNPQFVTKFIKDADFFYLPVYWTRFFLNIKNITDVYIYESEINELIIDHSKTFTVCQYDDGCLINLGDTIQFLSSRKSDKGFDIPLLSKHHNKPFFNKEKKIYASFIGRKRTSEYRDKMFSALENIDNVYLKDSDKVSTSKYRNIILESYISLCPRGYGGSSFRLFESMQLGSVPYLFADIDTRPFKDFINWDQFSFFSDNENKLINDFSLFNIEELRYMGQLSNAIFNGYIDFQKWPFWLIQTLKKLQ